MRWTWGVVRGLVGLVVLVATAATAAGLPVGEPEQIKRRQQWFNERRGLKQTPRARELRAKAVRELQQASMTRTLSLAGPGEVWAPLGPTPLRMPWEAQGVVSGRINVVAVHPTDESTLYVGAGAGGVWKTTNGGASWAPIFDGVGTLPVSSIYIEPGAPNNVWVGTGDRVSGCHAHFGQGLYLSTDGGATWTARNGGSALTLSIVNAVALQPGNASVVLAGGAGSCDATGSQVGDGLYRSADRGATWARVLEGRVEDVVYTSATVAYATVTSMGVYKSTNGGATWALASNGIQGPGSRLRLAVSGTTLYVLSANGDAGEVYRSTDAAATWTRRNTDLCDTQCWYNAAIGVHPTNPAVLAVSGVNTTFSNDGGATQTWPQSEQSVHADVHGIVYSKLVPGRFYLATDGGLWRGDPLSATQVQYTNLNSNLSLTMFYDVAVHPHDDTRLWGGTQDNHSAVRLTTNVWEISEFTGDGFMNAVDPSNPAIVFTESYPGGGLPSIRRSRQGGVTGTFEFLPTAGLNTSFYNWVTPLALAGDRVFTASDVVYRGTSAALPFRWTAVSQSLGSNVTFISPLLHAGKLVVYVGTGAGKVYRTDDGGAASVTWRDVSGTASLDYVSDIAMDPTNPLRVFATRSHFGGAKLLRSTTGGTTWTPVGTGLPDVPANTVVVDPVNLQRVFVGTDVGVFESSDGGSTFAAFSNGLPLGVVVTDLEVDDVPHVLVAGTYGRGAYRALLGNAGGNTPPVASFTRAISGLSVTFTDNSLDPDGTIASWRWYFSDGTSAQGASPTKTFAAPGDYAAWLVVTDNGGASHTATTSFHVGTLLPAASFNSRPAGDRVVEFIDTSIDVDGTVTAWAWDFGDGTTSTAANPKKTYAAAGEYTVGLTVTDNEGGRNTVAVAVNAVEAGQVMFPAATFPNLSGATGSSKRFFFEVPQGGTNLVVSTSGGTGNVNLYVRFDAEPTTTTYTCRSVQAANAETCTIAAPSAGTYHVLLYGASAYSGVTLTGNYTRPANQAPIADFTVPEVTGLRAVFADASSDPDGYYLSRMWSFGDGSTATDYAPAHTYAAAGTYQVKLTVRDGDGATRSVTKSVTVGGATNQPPVVSFTHAVSGLTATFTSSASDPDGSVTAYAWTFGDGATSSAANPSRTYAAAGTYTVQLVVTDDRGASASTTRTVTVTAPNQPPVANFTHTVSGLTASFTDASSDADGTIASRAWTFGDGATSTAASPTRTYAAAGTYSVQLTVTDDAGASHSVTRSVTVTGGGNVLQNGVAVSNLSAASKGSVQYTLVVPSGQSKLVVTTTGGSGDADLYVRRGSPATTTAYDCKSETGTSTETCTLNAPVAGTYYILVYGYSAFSGVTLKGTYSAAANQAPVANFTFTTSGLTATFTDASTDADGTIASRSWAFGDGATSTLTAPSRTYAAAGTYSVQLTVTDNAGATHSVTKSVTVSAGNVLQNGVPVTGLSAATGGTVSYTLVVPAGRTTLTIATSGGTGDSDMYVRLGSAPTTSTYDCRPYKTGNAETCTFSAPAAGTYHVMLRAYSAFSGLTLTGTYSPAQ